MDMEHVKFLKGVCGKLVLSTMTLLNFGSLIIIIHMENILHHYCAIQGHCKTQYVYSKEPWQDCNKAVFTILKISPQYYFEI